MSIRNLWAVAAALLVLSAPFARAEEFPGGRPSSDDEFKKGFGASEGLTDLDKGEADRDRLKIGGTMWSELQYYRLSASASPGPAKSSYFLNPNVFSPYFDARLKNDIRGYVKVKAVFDPTANASSVSPFTGQSYSKIQSDLEEMKLLFNINKSVFFTLGKQKIKWGSGKFWNPTDMLNSQYRDILLADDLRSGVSLIKTHVPVGAANLYLVNRIDNADQPDLIQHALRAELPVSSAELAATATFMKGKKPVIGLDLSTAVSEFDAYGEVSYTQGSDQTYYGAAGPYSDPERAVANWVTGLSYDYKYSDSDTVTLAAEYFHNDTGSTRTEDYGLVLANRAYQPYHLSQRYGMFMVLIPNPGNWNKVTFTLLNLANLSDYSGLTRLNIATTALDDLKLAFGVAAHYGNGNGEFKLGGQTFDASTKLQIDF